MLFVSIQMGSTIALKAFAATIIGGFGDVAGAIVGGFAIGIIETFGAAYIPCRSRTPSPFSCSSCSSSFGRKACSASGSRRRHERSARLRSRPDRLWPLRRRGRGARGEREDGRLCRQHPDAGLDLRDRRHRPVDRARPVRPDQSRASRVFRAWRLQRRPRNGGLSPALLALPRGGDRDRRGRRRRARRLDAAPGRTLPGDGHDLVSADPDRRPHQRDRLQPRSRRRQLDRAARLVRLGPSVPCARRRDARGLRLFRLAASGHAARARDARGARQ